jgi:hypothetical protein
MEEWEPLFVRRDPIQDGTPASWSKWSSSVRVSEVGRAPVGQGSNRIHGGGIGSACVGPHMHSDVSIATVGESV